MPIKVNISLSSGGRFKPVSSHTLHDKRITVGRDKDCTITLEDTQKHVSRMHVELEEADGSYWLKVVSKVNPVIVNGKRYIFENRVPMAVGDQITVGLYKLEIAATEAAPVARAEPPKRPAESAEDITYVARPGSLRPDFPPPRAAPPATPVAVPPAPAPASPASAPPDALPQSAVDAEESTYIPSAKAAPQESPGPKGPPPHMLLPETAAADDEVTYIPPMSARTARASGPEATADQGFSEDLTSIRRPVPKPPVTPAAFKAADPDASVPAVAEGVPDLDLDLSDVFGDLEEQTAVRSLPVQAEPQVKEEPNGDIEEGFSEDLTYVRKPIPVPKAAVTPAAPPRVAPAQPTFADVDSLAEEETHYRPAARQASPSVSSGQPLAHSVADPATQAFLEGAGLTHLRIPDAEAFMRQSGVMVRAAVEGIMTLMMAREEATTRLGAEPSRESGDNPLKSMADPAEVIAFLFDPNRPPIGDTDPVRALANACSDLRAHQVALLEGMRAAVMSALHTLDPKKIEKDHGVNLGGLNLTRKSKLWDISAAQYETLARGTEEEFNQVFGREILAAYTAQMHKMRGGR